MGYLVWVCLLFVPLVLLLCAAWAFVRWKNEHEDEKKALASKKRSRKLLIAAVAAAVVFFALHLIFPLPTI